MSRTIHRSHRCAQTVLSGSRDEPIRFEEDLYTPFYGGRQFSIQDNNGLNQIFWQPEWLSPSAAPTPDSSPGFG